MGCWSWYGLDILLKCFIDALVQSKLIFIFWRRIIVIQNPVGNVAKSN